MSKQGLIKDKNMADDKTVASGYGPPQQNHAIPKQEQGNKNQI